MQVVSSPAAMARLPGDLMVVGLFSSAWVLVHDPQRRFFFA
jgi:hypothetical protein